MQVQQSQTREASLFCCCLSVRWSPQAWCGMELPCSHLHKHHFISKPGALPHQVLARLTSAAWPASQFVVVYVACMHSCQFQTVTPLLTLYKHPSQFLPCSLEPSKPHVQLSVGPCSHTVPHISFSERATAMHSPLPLLLLLLDGSKELPGEPTCPSAGLLAALPGSPPTLEGDSGAGLAPEGARGVSGM